MLHLQTRVHFEEVEIAGLVSEKLDRARVVVAGGARRSNGRFSHALAHSGYPGHQRRWRFLDHFLMPALHRAFALAEVNHIAMPVAQHLDLDVARILDQLFDVDAAVAEGALGFARCGFERGSQIFVAIHAAHAFASAACDGLEHDGKAGVPRESDGVCGRHYAGLGARDNRRAPGLRYTAGFRLRSHERDRPRRRADESESGILARLREPRVLAEESVARMNGVDTVTAGGIEYPLDIQVAFRRRRSADMGGFVGFADVQRGAVRVGVDGHRANAHLAQRADDAQGDLAAIGDQNLWEH